MAYSAAVSGALEDLQERWEDSLSSPASMSAPITSPTAETPSIAPAPAAPESWPWSPPGASRAAASTGKL